MRISDWSSDVCSSDLPDEGQEEHSAEEQPAVLGCVPVVKVDQHRDYPVIRTVVVEPQMAKLRKKLATTVDRKSVVEGKSVSVRVDLGGRRIIKQKTYNERQ